MMMSLSSNFGLLTVSIVIFALTYAAILTEKIHRAVIALIGAGLMILSGVITQQQAVAGIDFNTIGLLTGMMVIVVLTQKSGVFQYVAVVAAKAVKADPWWLLVMFGIVTAVFSALLDNVTTVMLVTPVTLLITQGLRISPYPFLFTIIFASNIGGTSTLIGDPPNIMIGSAAGLSFMDFLTNLAPIAIIILFTTLIPIYFIWGRKLQAAPDNRAQVMQINARETIQDARLLKQSLSILALVIAGFTLSRELHLEPATIALFGAAILLLLRVWNMSGEEQSHQVQRTLSELEWGTIFFFIGLFIVVTGIEHAGALKWLSDAMIDITQGNYRMTTLAILWVSAILSALVDNIPFVATMIPVIQNMAPVFGAENLEPLWWALALGACLGGNGTLIGASANLIVAGLADRADHPIHFLPFMRIAFPLMLLSIVLCHAYIYLRYLT
ncbi:MAG: ArsB/NhaD family transporter [Methylobacillus sp.]|jgi:Na+/H+ antiporter NhaD/arsenite permease-like protein|nr:ArsB/NhaD family transporter [Methylobacillus sp.]